MLQTKEILVLQTNVNKNSKTWLPFFIAACLLLCVGVTFLPAFPAHAASLARTDAQVASSCSSPQLEALTNVYDSSNAFLGSVRLYASSCNGTPEIWGTMFTYNGTLAKTVQSYVEYTNKFGFLTSGVVNWPSLSSAIDTPRYHDAGTDFYAEVHVIDFYGKSIWAGTISVCAFC